VQRKEKSFEPTPLLAGGAEERESWRSGGCRKLAAVGGFTWGEHRVLGYNDWMRLGAV
jgi:hypothetical protein